MRSLASVLLLFVLADASAQIVTNISCTSPIAVQVMKGQYDPAAFAASDVINDHQDILCALRTRVSADSLKSYLQALEAFHNRNSHSDTVSNTTGIGAARRWAFAKFQAFSAANENRLLPAFVQFDFLNGECADAYGWRNTIAVLPGSNVTDPSIVLVEAHLDSRCADNCDGQCLATGMEDNGSGCALVLELARVMSRYTFDHTLVFMLTTGEEQGLAGAEAMATWCEAEGITIKGVQNNDIVGGILCGATSSDPGCEVELTVDSLNLRLFSNGSVTKTHRGFARSIKMWYQEKLQAHVPVPMTIQVMAVEDRADRGGDHIPFRQHDFRSLRFTAAHEHGDANVEDSTYHDRQHTSDDILGVDTDGDLVVDSFFVDFNYLARNTVINGMSMALMALGPEPPAFQVLDEPTGLRVAITPTPDLAHYRVGVRNSSASLDFDAVYLTDSTSFLIPNLETPHTYIVSVAGIDSEGITSPFSNEVIRNNDAATPAAPVDNYPFTIACAPIGYAEPALPNNLTCWPVPVRGNGLLYVDVAEGRHLLQLVGADGRAWPLRVKGSHGSVAVELPQLPTGIYLLRGTKRTVRFMVE